MKDSVQQHPINEFVFLPGQLFLVSKNMASSTGREILAEHGIAYKRQIVAGLNYCITGLPYWTTDIGGFFRPGKSQYTDEKYQELLTRWFQWGAFNPIFRIHGYQSETEPWKYGQQVEDNMRKMLNLRYRLLPYIYSEAWQITKNGSTMMRPLVMDFNERYRCSKPIL